MNITTTVRYYNLLPIYACIISLDEIISISILQITSA